MYYANVPALLELRHYETLVAVIDAGSVGAAATQLSVTQSAVSHRIAEAERRLGVDLFERRPARTMLPTPAGLALYQAAQRGLPELLRGEQDVVRVGGDAQDVVRIGVASYDCYHWFPSFHEVTLVQLPHVLLELVVVGNEPFERLQESVVDVVLAPMARGVNVRAQELFVDELVLLVHPDHPVASMRWAPPEVAEGEVFLTYNSEPVPGFEYERFLRPAGVAPRAATVIQQTGAIAEMVASGLGMAILSRWAVTPWLDSGTIAAVRCGEDGLSLDWSALTRLGTPETSVEQATVDLLATHLGQLVHEATM